MGEAVLAWSSGRRVLYALVALALGGGALFAFGPYEELKSATGQRVFPEETITQLPALQAFLTEVGASGRELYLRIQLWDLLNPILIGLFGVTLLAWLIRLSTQARGRSLLLVVPLVGPCADLIENALLLRAIAAFPDEARAASLLPIVSGAKFIGIAVTLFLCISLVGLYLRRRVGSST